MHTYMYICICIFKTLRHFDHSHHSLPSGMTSCSSLTFSPFSAYPTLSYICVCSFLVWPGFAYRNMRFNRSTGGLPVSITLKKMIPCPPLRETIIPREGWDLMRPFCMFTVSILHTSHSGTHSCCHKSNASVVSRITALPYFPALTSFLTLLWMPHEPWRAYTWEGGGGVCYRCPIRIEHCTAPYSQKFH